MVYFPDAWAEIAKVSVLGNKQHNLGAEKLYFNRTVSTDHANKVIRHMLDHAAGNTFDTDGTYHLAKAAWRALAALQVAIEQTASVDEIAEVVVRDPALCQCGLRKLPTFDGGKSYDSWDERYASGAIHYSDKPCHR